MKKYFESDDILALLWRWKKSIVLVGIISFILSAFISSPIVIKPKYKSYIKAYPSNVSKYSEESPTEQMLQFLESDIIRDKLIEEFDLMKHYQIKENDDHKINRLYKEYEKNFKFSKTKFESVEIEVTDISPDTAYLLINRLVALYNEQVKLIQDAQTRESVKTLEIMIREKEVQMDSVEQNINYLREKYGILDYNSQVENLSKEYYKLLGRRNYDPNKLNDLEKELNRLKEKGGEFQRLNQLINSFRDEYTRIKIEYDQQKKELLRNKNYINIVVNAYKSDKKVYPVRWLIVSISVVVSLVVAISVISFIDRIDRNIK